MSRGRIAPFLVLPIFLAQAGCDAGEYQRRMDLAKARLSVFDEENKYLGQPLENPMVKDTKEVLATAWPFVVYLRLPKGHGTAPADKKENGELGSVDFRVFRYPGDSERSNLFVAAGNLVGSATEPETGKKSLDPATSTGFRDSMIQLLRKHTYHVLKRNPSVLKGPEDKTILIPNPGGEKSTLKFDVYLLEGAPFPVPPGKDKAEGKEEGVAFLLYHHKNADKQIGLAFQVPASKKEEPAELKRIDMCLRTLAIGEAAPARRAEFDKRHKK